MIHLQPHEERFNGSSRGRKLNLQSQLSKGSNRAAINTKEKRKLDETVTYKTKPLLEDEVIDYGQQSPEVHRP